MEAHLRNTQIAARFGSPHPVVGMVHLPPLPGSPGWGGVMEPVLERAMADARSLVEGGVDGVLVENFGDVPFHPGPVPPETVAALALAVSRVQAVVEDGAGAADAHSLRGPLPVGLNVLRNDARSGVGIAAVTGAAFLRVNVHTGSMFTDQGLLEGRAHETLRERIRLAPDLLLLADVHVKHATPPAGASLEEAARDAVHRGLADILVVSGSGTGKATDPERIRRVRRAVPETPVWVGSGADASTAEPLVGAGAQGFIVGSALHREGEAGRGIDPARVRAFVAAVRQATARHATG
jgi:uncharacterized protein